MSNSASLTPQWYEPFDRYTPNDELLRVIRAVIPPTWRLRRDSIWFYVFPPDVNLPQQGWKIHISATHTNCEEILRTVAKICLQMGTPFKFNLDRWLVLHSTHKGWPRQASGKFVTIYPLNDQHFRALIDALYLSLQHCVGPYILSDKRYKDARVLYYRYGGIDGAQILTSSGDQQPMLVSPNGELVPDVRMPYWSPPPWVVDPFEEANGEASEPTLKDGRYRIEGALAFSVTGGVYLALDQTTGDSVVIKEARPATGVDENGTDAVDRLRKEYRLLQKLHHTGITPRPLICSMIGKTCFLLRSIFRDVISVISL